MKRRTFLALSAAGFAGAALPDWMARCFAGDIPPAEARKALRDAYQRAKERGKPLLVVVIPTADDAKALRGEIAGQFFTHGGEEVHADLALCEVVCATVADAKASIPFPRGDEEPLFVLVEAAEADVSAHAIAPDLQVRVDESRPDLENEGVIEREHRARIARIAKALRARVAPDVATLERRARSELRSVPEAERAKVEASCHETAPDDVAERFAGAIRLRAEKGEIPRAKAVARLARVADARYVKSSPPGARWGQNTGCGVRIEGELDIAVACGMGFVPKLSERFLYFFAKEK